MSAGQPPPEPAGPPDAARIEPNERTARLSAYFREHAGRYTGDALRKAAREAGYDDAEIESAWPTVMWTTPTSSPGRTNRIVATAIAALYVLGLYAAIAILGGLGNGGAATPVALGITVAALVAWARFRDDRPSLAAGLGCGVLASILIPVVIFLAILGICIVTGASFLGSPS
jgi:hypothetical protein